MKKIKKSYFIIFILLILSIVCFGASYAIFMKADEYHGKLNIMVGNLTYKMQSNDLEKQQIKVPADTVKVIDISVTSLNSISSKYILYYNLEEGNTEDVIVGYDDNYDAASGKIESSGQKNIRVFINNKSSQDIILEFGIEGGLANNDLVLSQGKNLIDDPTIPTIVMNSDLPNSITRGDSYTILESYTTSSISGGKVSCSSDIDGVIMDTSSLSTGNHTITCTVTTGAGKKATTSKTIQITYSPYTATNLITNGSFENDLSDWTLLLSSSDASISTTYKTSGNNSLKIDSNNSAVLIDSNLFGTPINHKFYASIDYYSSSINSGLLILGEFYGGDKLDFSMGALGSTITATNNNWAQISAIIDNNNLKYTTSIFRIGSYPYNNHNPNIIAYLDSIIVIDLTATFGSGNEPDKEWCDKHINYFDGTTTIYK